MISVLMTSYNREKWIGQAIESVLGSTFTDFELIIVDDNSTDNTVAIAKKYAAGDNRIKVFVNEKNLGDYPNRNKAASLAKGKYLKFVDSDDYMYSHGLELMLEAMEQFPEAGFGLCSLKPDKNKPFPFMLSPKEAYEYHFLGPGLFHKGPLTAIFLRSAFESCGGFKDDRMISDTDMWHRMGIRFPVVLMPDGIVWQRLHDQQELNDAHCYIAEAAKIKWNYLLSPQCPLSKEQLKFIRRKRIKRYTGFILSGLSKLDFSKASLYTKCLLQEIKVKIS